MDNLVQVAGNKDNGHDAEQGKEKLGENLHAECHSVVLGEIDVKPVGNVDALVQEHVRLDSNLDKLVNDQYHNDDSSRQPALRKELPFFHAQSNY